MNKDNLIYMAEVLREAATEVDFVYKRTFAEPLGVNYVGICSLVTAISYEVKDNFDINHLDGIFRRWPKYSGVMGFPISSRNGVYAADEYHAAGNMWNPDTTYGQLRRELALFVADELFKLAGVEPCTQMKILQPLLGFIRRLVSGRSC